MKLMGSIISILKDCGSEKLSEAIQESDYIDQTCTLFSTIWRRFPSGMS